MDIQAIDQAAVGSYGDNSQESKQSPPPPPANDVSNFNSAMQNNAGNDSAKSNEGGGNSALDDPQTKELLTKVLDLVQQLLQQMQGDTKGGSTAGPNGGVNPVEGPGPGGSAGNEGTGGTEGTGGNGGSGGNNSGELIPPPTEHIQQLNLGGKTVTVGGDGSASAEEVGQTAQSIENMYQNSPTFKNMIDNSSDPSFEVSVGKRDDNTSWGNSEGRVFMNINNVEPGNSDSFQSLLSHEFAHASIDLGHGAEMERLENQAASEA